jgi:hypothetical protein
MDPDGDFQAWLAGCVVHAGNIGRLLAFAIPTVAFNV